MTLLSRRHVLSCAFALISLPALFAQPQPSPKSAEEIVQLPAVVIEDRGFGKQDAQHWFHAELPGIEVLSCLPRADTAEIV